MLPILEILYHVEDRNSHHVYMALIILLILTEDDTFNRSIHEVVGTRPPLHGAVVPPPGVTFHLFQVLKNITWYSERSLTEISLGSLLILVVIRTIQFNMTRTRVGRHASRGTTGTFRTVKVSPLFVSPPPEQDKYLHTNCLAALANMSAQFRRLHQYAAQRIIR